MRCVLELIQIIAREITAFSGEKHFSSRERILSKL